MGGLQRLSVHSASPSVRDLSSCSVHRQFLGLFTQPCPLQREKAVFTLLHLSTVMDTHVGVSEPVVCQGLQAVLGLWRSACWGGGVSWHSGPSPAKLPTLQVPTLWKCQHDVAVGTFPSPDVIFWGPLLLLCASCRGFLLPFLSSWPWPCPCCLSLTRQGLAMSHIPHFLGDYSVA